MTDKEVREQLAAEVKLEDLKGLPPATILAIKAIGVDLFVEMSHEMGGISIYIPKFESVIAAARDRLIIKDFAAGQCNYTQLAMKYNISEVWVRNIVNRHKVKQNSISLFIEDVKDG